MTQRSRSTVDRDYKRAAEHRVYLELVELRNADWETVDDSEVLEYVEVLETLESNCENEGLCIQIRELIDLLNDLID